MSQFGEVSQVRGLFASFRMIFRPLWREPLLQAWGAIAPSSAETLGLALKNFKLAPLDEPETIVTVGWIYLIPMAFSLWLARKRRGGPGIGLALPFFLTWAFAVFYARLLLSWHCRDPGSVHEILPDREPYGPHLRPSLRGDYRGRVARSVPLGARDLDPVSSLSGGMLRLCRLVGERALGAGDSDRDHSSAHGRDVQASWGCPYPARIDRARHALLRGGRKRRLYPGVLRQISTPNSAALPHRPPRQEGLRNLPGPNERPALCNVPSTSLRILGRSVARGSVSHTRRMGRALLILGQNTRHLGPAHPPPKSGQRPRAPSAPNAP